MRPFSQLFRVAKVMVANKREVFGKTTRSGIMTIRPQVRVTTRIIMVVDAATKKVALLPSK